jgi:hypothetical protein
VEGIGLPELLTIIVPPLLALLALLAIRFIKGVRDKGHKPH